MLGAARRTLPPCEGDMAGMVNLAVWPTLLPSPPFPFLLYTVRNSRASSSILHLFSQAWGGISPIMKTRLMISSTWRDLQWLWMFRWQWVWGLLPFQVFLGYPLGDLRVDLTQLSFRAPNRMASEVNPDLRGLLLFLLISSGGASSVRKNIKGVSFLILVIFSVIKFIHPSRIALGLMVE
uniref:Uncharacterized protein n=1 Tax=Fagus sylvatica TaxID=28930 RepID=A0A2N9EHP8_FAGSY